MRSESRSEGPSGPDFLQVSSFASQDLVLLVAQACPSLEILLGSVSEPEEVFVRNQNIFLCEAKFVRWTNSALVLPRTSASAGQCPPLGSPCPVLLLKAIPGNLGKSGQSQASYSALWWFLNQCNGEPFIPRSEVPVFSSCSHPVVAVSVEGSSSLRVVEVKSCVENRRRLFRAFTWRLSRLSSLVGKPFLDVLSGASHGSCPCAL